MARILLKIKGKMILNTDYLIVLAQEIDAHSGVDRLDGSPELRDIIVLLINAVEYNGIAVSEIISEERLHILEVFAVCRRVDNNYSSCERPAFGYIDLLEKLGRGDGTVPLDEYDARLVFCLDIESQLFGDLIGVTADNYGICALIVLFFVFFFTFFGVDNDYFAVFEILSADPGTDHGSLSAVQKTGKEIYQTIIHKNAPRLTDTILSLNCYYFKQDNNIKSCNGIYHFLGVSMKSVKIGEIVLKNPVALSPMAGVSSLPFRVICNGMGACYSPTELVSARSIRFNGVDKSYRYMRISPEKEGITAIQLFGSEPEDFESAIETIMETPVLNKVSIIDINMGCPVPKVVKTGSGSALMEDPVRASNIVKACKKTLEGLRVKIPVTVKTRTGFKAGDNGKPDFAKALADAGCDMICVHGRTRPQMYQGESSVRAIAVMREAVRDYVIPFFANGDICDVDSARKVIEQTGCDGIMIGRAARGNPWIFEQVTAGLAGKEIPACPYSGERKKMLIRELEGRLKYLPEETAVREFRSVMPFYIKGLPGGNQIKVRLVNAKSFDEVKEILDAD